MVHNAPGRSHRAGISVIELANMFPDEKSAENWFESLVWPNGRHCGKCGCADTFETNNRKPMPYRCRGCGEYFSVRTGTAIERSKVPLRKWAFAIYLHMTSLKGVSSMKLHRDIHVTQKTAWFMLGRLREAWKDETGEALFTGPVEADETYMGGREANKHGKKKLRAGRGAVGKTAVAGIKDRETGKIKARVVESADGETLRGFVEDSTTPEATVFTDEARAYQGLARTHETVNHSVGEYVSGMAHTNGIESFWATLKRAHKGVYHKMSPKHLHRYIREFAGKHNIRDKDTLDQMGNLVARMVGKRLMYRELIR